MRIRAIAATMALAAVTASPLFAQRSIRFGIAASAGVPVGQFSDRTATGPGFLGIIAFGPSDSPIGLRIDASNHKIQGRNRNNVQYEDVNVTAVTLNLVGTLSGEYVKPYAIAGGGWYPFRPTSAAKRQSDWGLNGGLGLTFPLLPSAYGFLESRYHRIYGRTMAERYMTVSFGVMM